MLHARQHIHAAFAQPPSRDYNVRIHAVAFDLSSIHTASFKLLRPFRHDSVAPALRGTHAAFMQQHQELEDFGAKEAEGPTRWRHGEGQHLRQLQ